MTQAHLDGPDLVVVGQGYVGLPLAMRAVETGHGVVGFDTDERLTGRLAAGDSHVEDVTSEQLRQALAGGYSPTSDPSRCGCFRTAVITVPTPLTDGVPDLSYVESAARILAPRITPGSCVILESTTYPGTTEELVGPILEEGAGLKAGVDFHLGYSPERIDPGNTEWPFHRVPKIVSGINEHSLDAVTEFYEGLVDRVVAVSSCKVAELAKLLENTFRHVNIALVNEIAMFARELDIEVWEAIEAASTKPFGYMPFAPGPGVGGHCLPIDPSYLAWRVRRALGHSFRFVELANDVNAHMPDYVVQRVVLALNRRAKAVNGSRVLVLGLAYKRNTGDARESPAVEVVERLHGMGADVRVCDPHVDAHPIDELAARVECCEPELLSSDAVVLITDHDSFDYDAIARHSSYVFDTRNRLGGDNVECL